MKLTEAKKKSIKEFLTKKHSIKEGVIEYIFGKILVNKLKNDKSFIAMAKKLDADMQELRDEVERLKANGERIPLSYKNILNIKD
jgi:cobalamin biosynthesis protein CobT